MRSSAFLRLEVLDRQQDGGTEHQRPADACHAIGFIPHSIGMIAGDIDHGNAKARRALIELWQSQHHAPHAIMPTQRGEHWLWFCTLPARRARWPPPRCSCRVVSRPPWPTGYAGRGAAPRCAAPTSRRG